MRYPALVLGFVLDLAFRPCDQQRPDRDRGDVPGWVLITVMTAALVTLIWGLFGNKIQTLLTTSLDSVTGPGGGGGGAAP